jgi:tetratricopeptide (TPR) repeat protein
MMSTQEIHTHLKASLTKKIGALLRAQGSDKARDLAGVSASAEACLQVIKEHLVGLDEELTRELIGRFAALFEAHLDAMWADAYSEEESILGALKVGRRWVEATLSEAPWCPLSEATLISMSDELLSTLGATPSGVEFVMHGVASCEPQLWVERGLSEALEEALERVEERASAGSDAQLEGLWVSGVGASASLAWAHRALLERGVEVLAPLPACALWSAPLMRAWLNTAQDTTQANTAQANTAQADTAQKAPRALLIDDLHLADRSVMWGLAELLSSEGACDLIVWTGADVGPASALAHALKRPPLTLDLAPWGESEWRAWSRKAGGERCLSARAEGLSPVDTLRIAERGWLTSQRGLVSMIELPSDEPVEPIEQLAALFGPLTPTRPLIGVITERVEGVEGLLTFNGFTQVAPNESWGVLWQHGARARWGEQLTGLANALKEGSPQREERTEQLARLEAQLSDPQHAPLRWCVVSALKRLAYLRAQPSLTLPLSAPSLTELEGALERLKPSLATPQPHPYTLSVLCGLAFEWAQWGPRWGMSRETLSALKLGVTAAQRLNDALKSARLLFTLGRLALSEGLAGPAREALEACTQLFAALKQPQEALQALYMWSEAELLAGSLGRASQVLERGEALTRSLGYEGGLWPLRFKRGLLARSRGAVSEALELWRVLPLEGVSVEMARALRVERVYALLLRGNTGDLTSAEGYVHELEVSEGSEGSEGSESTLTRLLRGLMKAMGGDDEALQALLPLLIELNQAREVGSWLMGCELWAHAVLRRADLPEGALEAVTRALEGAVKGASGLRSQLQLTRFYEQLSACYERRGLTEEAIASLAFSQAWRAQLKGEVACEVERLGLSPLEARLKAREGLSAQVREEVEALRQAWATQLISELSAAAQGTQAQGAG